MLAQAKSANAAAHFQQQVLRPRQDSQASARSQRQRARRRGRAQQEESQAAGSLRRWCARGFWRCADRQPGLQEECRCSPAPSQEAARAMPTASAYRLHVASATREMCAAGERPITSPAVKAGVAACKRGMLPSSWRGNRRKRPQSLAAMLRWASTQPRLLTAPKRRSLPRGLCGLLLLQAADTQDLPRPLVPHLCTRDRLPQCVTHLRIRRISHGAHVLARSEARRRRRVAAQVKGREAMPQARRGRYAYAIARMRRGTRQRWRGECAGMCCAVRSAASGARVASFM